MRTNQKLFFNVIYIIILFIWPLLSVFYLKIDGAGRVQAVMTLLAIAVNGKSLLHCPSGMKIWLLWVVYCIFNIHNKGLYVQDVSVILWIITHLVCPLVTMIVVYNAYIYNNCILSRVIFYSFIVFVVIGAFNVSVGESAGRYENAMGNSYMNNAVLLLTFMALYFKNKRISGSYYFIILLVMAIVVLSGERKALIALFIILAGMFVSRNTKNLVSVLITLLFILIVMYFTMPYVIQNTSAGDRMVSQFEDNQFAGNLFLQLMGDRAPMYVIGFDAFLNNMWTGIGISNFPNLLENTHSHALHSEYMVQLTECGLIGALLFLFFYIGMIVGLLRTIKNSHYRHDALILSSTLLAIIAMNFTTWTYDGTYFFMFFGVVYATIKNSDSSVLNHTQKSLKNTV